MHCGDDGALWLQVFVDLDTFDFLVVRVEYANLFASVIDLFCVR
jgi:hypothetical protein